MKRFLAGFLSFALITQTVTMSHAAFSPIATLPFASLVPPSNIADLTDASVGSQAHTDSKLPDVILIQDLHFNYSVQKNIAALLNFLEAKQAIGPAIAVEGAVGTVDNSLLTNVQDMKIRGELADFLMQNGELTGSQFYSVMSSQPKILQGVEDPENFQANLDIFRTSYTARESALEQIQSLHTRLQTLTPTLYSRPVRKIEKLKKHFDEGSLSFPDFVAHLDSEARGQVARPAGLDGQAQGDPTQAVLDYAASVEQSIARNPDEQNLIWLLHWLGLTEQALAQRTTFEEIKAVSAHLDQISEAVQALSKDLPEASAADLPRLKDAMRASVDFYVAALMRNDPMLANTLKLSAQNGAAGKPTVLVVGGFHTAFLQKELARQGRSVVIYTPRLDSSIPFNDAIYTSRLLGHRLTIWEAVESLETGKPAVPSVSSLNELGLIPTPTSVIRSIVDSVVNAGGISKFRGSNKSGEIISSFFGSGSEGNKFIARLNKTKEKQPWKFSTTPKVVKTTADFIVNPNKDPNKSQNFQDSQIPHGDALEAVLSFIYKVDGWLQPSLNPENGRLKLEFPFEEMVFTDAPSVNIGVNSEKEVDITKGAKRTMFYTEETPEGKWRAIVHTESLKRPDVNPFRLYLRMALHEIVEFQKGPDDGSLDEALQKAGLGPDFDPSWSADKIITEFNKFLPGVHSKFLGQHDIKAVVEYYDLAFELQAQKEKETGQIVPIEKYSGQDIRDMTDRVRRLGLQAEDVEIAQSSDFKNVFDPKNISPERRKEAIKALLSGRIPRQIYGGGDANRMKTDLEELGVANLLNLTPEEVIAMWFLPVGELVGFEGDMHLGAMQMLRYNEAIRKLARENPDLNISEQQALANQRIIIHVKDKMEPEIHVDFKKHEYYGFNPAHVYFVPSPEYLGIKLDERGLADLDKNSTSVLGNGVPTELLAYPNWTGVALNGVTISRLRRSVLEEIIKDFPGQEVIIRQVRINDLKALDPDPIDVDKLAYSMDAIEKGGATLTVEMVPNPDLALSGASWDFRKGELNEKGFLKENQQGRRLDGYINKLIAKRYPTEANVTESMLIAIFNEFIADKHGEIKNEMENLSKGVAVSKWPSLGKLLALPGKKWDKDEDNARMDRRTLLMAAYPLTTKAKKQKGGVVFIIKKGLRMLKMEMPDSLSLLGKKMPEKVAAAQAASEARGEVPLVNQMGGYASAARLLEVLKKGLPVEFEAVYKNKATANFLLPPDIILAQIVTGDVTFEADTFFFVNADNSPDGKNKLTDFKQLAYSQMVPLAAKVEATYEDGVLLGLAAAYGFDISPQLRVYPQAEYTIASQLVSLMAPNEKASDTMLERIQKTFKEVLGTNVHPARSVDLDINHAPLNGRQAHKFVGIMAAVILIAAMINPIALAIAAPWAVAAVAQEAAVIHRAVRERNMGYLTNPNLWAAEYDFDHQQSKGTEMLGAHAHEIARALTQSRNGIVPRLIAPIALALAAADRLIAIFFDGLNWILNKISGKGPPDPGAMSELQNSRSTVHDIITEPASTALPEASGYWAKIKLAMSNNSEARQSAEALKESIARAQIGSAA